MTIISTFLKKCRFMLIATITILFITTQPANADENTPLLQGIFLVSAKILKTINESPAYIYSITMLAQSWLDPDKSDETKNAQGLFSNLGNIANYDGTAIQLTKDFINLGGSGLPAYSNDLAFSTLTNTDKTRWLQWPDPRMATFMGVVVNTNNINPVYNYLKNISGANFKLNQPAYKSKASQESQDQYLRLYSTLTAIQSYNNYVLGNYLAGLQQKSTSDRLVQQATDGGWLAQIAAESLGRVLRQMLLYNSQSYVLLTRMLETERQMAATQAMTNTLLMTTIENTSQMMQNVNPSGQGM